MGNTDVVDFEVSDLLERNGIQIDPKCASYKKLAYAILRASVEVNALLAKRQEGEAIDTPEAPAISRAKADVSDKSKTLQSVFNRWKAERKPAAKTVLEFTTVVRRFEELNGDTSIEKVDRHMVVGFEDALLKLPNRPSNSVRKLTVQEQIRSLE